MYIYIYIYVCVCVCVFVCVCVCVFVCVCVCVQLHSLLDKYLWKTHKHLYANGYGLDYYDSGSSTRINLAINYPRFFIGHLQKEFKQKPSKELFLVASAVLEPMLNS